MSVTVIEGGTVSVTPFPDRWPDRKEMEKYLRERLDLEREFSKGESISFERMFIACMETWENLR
jgi:hypothetical protein